MDGYWKRPEPPPRRFAAAGCIPATSPQETPTATSISSTAKDMIISGGFNIYPREVEDALMAHPAVASAAVIGIPDDTWGEAVKVFVVLKPGARNGAAAVQAQELQAWVKDMRGAPWSPKSIDFVDAISVTGLGKIDRKKLRAPYWTGRNRGVA